MFGMSMIKNRCGQSSYRTLKLTVSGEWADGINWFLHVDPDLQKLKDDRNFVGWA